jgi:hypothetical protein
MYNVTLRHIRATIVTGKTVSITYRECVLLPLVIRHAMRMHHILICDLFGCTKFFYIISLTVRFSGWGVIGHKMCFDFLKTFCLKHFSF